MTKKINKRVLVIAHEVFAPISKEAIEGILKKEGYETKPDIIPMNSIQLEYGKTRDINWKSLKAEQELAFNIHIKEKLKYATENGYQVCYFGLAPIPLAIHLGYLVGSMINVKVFLKNPHGKKEWKWGEEDFSDFEIVGMPKEHSPLKAAIAITLQVSGQIADQKISEIIPETERLATVDFKAKNNNRGLIGSSDTINKIGVKFSKILEDILKVREGTNAIHLFAAVPVGVAFRIGQEIIETMHPFVYVYEHHRTESPHCQEAFAVQEKTTRTLIIDDDDRIKIENWRKCIAEELVDTIPQIVTQIRDQGAETWFNSIFPKLRETSFQNSYWKHLHRLDQTELDGSEMSLEPLDSRESRYYLDRKWWLPDHFLCGLIQRFGNQMDPIYQAARLFFYREMIHRRSHLIKSENEDDLARFPQILTEADYQADVYAMLHEYRVKTPTRNKVVGFFDNLIDVITGTMWAEENFVKGQMEVRRLNRYLTWYYQQAKIRAADCESLEDVLEIFAFRPLVELKLQSVYTADKKQVKFNLEGFNDQELSIAVFHKNKVMVEPHGAQLNLKNLLEGFKEQEPEEIKKIMIDLLGKIGYEN